MKDTAINLMRDILPDGFVLQQDNCSIQVSKKVWTFLRRRELSSTLAQQDPGPQHYRKRVEHVEFKGL